MAHIDLGNGHEEDKDTSQKHISQGHDMTKTLQVGCSKSELSFASIWDGWNVCLYWIHDGLYKLPTSTEVIVLFQILLQMILNPY